MDDFTITTIYFDGQFWSAFIQKQQDGILYTGRHVFGEEPSNPQLLLWMVNGFADVPLYRTQESVKLRIKDSAKSVRGGKMFVPKSFDKFKEAQKKYFSEKSAEVKKERREEKQERYLRRKEKQRKRRG